MKLCVFSDIHGDNDALARLMETEADAWIAAGDLVSWERGLDAAGRILSRRAPAVWVLPGNHERESQIARFCAKFGLNALHGRWFDLEGWRIAGLGYSNPTPFNTPGEYTETELARRLERLAGARPHILVCHCPPVGTPLDEAAPGCHFGSAAVREYLAAHAPRWFFCGHIHEAAGRTVKIGATQAVNAGKRGYVLELPEGPPAP
jgi:Icc-related predicted phosphoesterase